MCATVNAVLIGTRWATTIETQSGEEAGKFSMLWWKNQSIFMYWYRPSRGHLLLVK